MRRRTSLPRSLTCLPLLALLASSGCSTFAAHTTTLPGDPALAKTVAPGQDVPQTASAEPSPPATFTIEIREAGEQPRAKQLPHAEDLFVQQALEKSGVVRKFRRMEITLNRRLPGGANHRIEIPFDRGDRQVRPEYDYAVRPGDRLVITEDTSTIFDDMLAKIQGPLEPVR